MEQKSIIYRSLLKERLLALLNQDIEQKASVQTGRTQRRRFGGKLIVLETEAIHALESYLPRILDRLMKEALRYRRAVSGTKTHGKLEPECVNVAATILHSGRKCIRRIHTRKGYKRERGTEYIHRQLETYSESQPSSVMHAKTRRIDGDIHPAFLDYPTQDDTGNCSEGLKSQEARHIVHEQFLRGDK
eukprot:gb/GECG01011178.1/.p1 GENE.gb/GECG01011178.1/~~gb/GECG01011178.1/.p1  ORF type:complete len:189 (+),score=15.92 gb/GECG01011178.1/:1-567(+)